MPVYPLSTPQSQGRDRILRGTGDTAPIRLVLLDATQAAQVIADQHQAKGFARGFLGETLAAALLLASRLKGQGTVQLRLQLTGDIGLCAADATPLGLVRARIPAEDLQRTGAFEPMVLPQLIKVRKLDAHGASQAESLVEMTSTDVSQCLSYYLAQSEQVEARLKVGSAISADGDRVLWCGGFLVETFPDAETATRQQLSSHLAAWDGLDRFYDENSGSLNLEALFEALRGEMAAHVHQSLEVTPFCPCSKEGVLRALASLVRSELESLLEDAGPVELHCDFCRRRYLAEKDEIQGLLDAMSETGDDSDLLP